jgi:LPXTG-site transpeptidase (sortase) family protein
MTRYRVNYLTWQKPGINLKIEDVLRRRQTIRAAPTNNVTLALGQLEILAIVVSTKYRFLAITVSVLIIMAASLAGPYFWAHVRFTFNPPIAETDNDNGKQVTIYEPNTLVIESLGIEAPIVYAADNNDNTFAAALAQGVVHYPGTARPGQPGNAYIFGHSSDLPWSQGDYKTVFALLPRVEIGAEVIVTDASGNAFTYTVTESFSAGANRVDLLANTPDEYRLTLQTSYPIGTALRRWIVISEIE